MNLKARIVIAVLGSLVVVLGLALAVVLSTDAEDGDVFSHPMGDSYQGMMAAIGYRDSDQMLERMKEILGPDAYETMLQHMAAHRAGATASDATIDSMMHQMMDGMFQRMPADRHNLMPSWMGGMHQ